MPRLVGSVPKYRKHRASGQAVVTLSGVDFYLGPYRTKISLLEYDRVVGEWLAAGRQLPLKDFSSLTIVELLARYWKHAKQYYRKDGRPTVEISNLLDALRPLKQLYGHTRACEFGPLALKALRDKLIEEGLSRKLINSRVGKIRGVFRWGVSEQLVAESVLTALESVEGLKEGRSAARETKPVEPVNAADFEATLVHLPEVVGDMARLQRLCGCRPGEVCALRPFDVDTSGDVWCYTPASTASRSTTPIAIVGSIRSAAAVATTASRRCRRIPACRSR
jgi:integrase